MATYGHTFTSGDTVTPTKLNNARTVTDIVNADIKSDAAIAGSKIDPSFNAPAVVAVNSATTALRVTQEGSGNALVVEDATNPDSTPLVVNSVGQIISGATTAFDGNAGLQITSDLTTAPNANIFVRRCNDTVNAAIALARSRGTAASQTGVQSDDSLGVIQFFGYNGTSASNVMGARILARLDAAPGASDMPSALEFHTRGSVDSILTERVRITSAGLVGIGTAAPTTALDVNGTVTATAFSGPINGNVTGNLTGTASAIADGAVTNAKVDASAAIAHSKLANATAGQVLLGTTTTGVITATTISGDVTVSGAGVAAIGAGVIVDADIASATITDAKLATISTAGKVSNSATTATSANTASAIVARDGSGNFSAGTITAALTGNVTGNVTGSSGSCTGNSATATTLATGRTIALTGDVTGTTGSFNGSANVSAATTIANNAVTTAKIADSNVTTAKLATATQQSLVPAGAVMPFAINSAPAGWLAADGAAVSRSTYAALFAAIGVTHGAGDSVTTFNLPDLRGIFVRGSGSQTVSGITYSKTFAAKEQDAMQGHAHAYTLFGIQQSPTANSYSTPAGQYFTSEPLNTGVPASDGTNGTPRTASETRPANIALLYCIKF